MNNWMLMIAVLLYGTASFAIDTKPYHAQQDLVVEQLQQRYVYPDPEIPTLRDIASHTRTEADEFGFEQRLWNLLAVGRLDILKQAIAQRQAKVSNWQPPPWLKVELARTELNARVDAARGKPAPLLALFNEHPEVFTCREYYNLWSLADAYRAHGQLRHEQEVHHQMLASCTESRTLLTTLDRIAAHEGEAIALHSMARLLQRNNQLLPTDEVAERHYRWSIDYAAMLRMAGQREEASVQLAAEEEQVETRRDLDAARLIAWNYRERAMHNHAMVWFVRVAEWSGREEDQLNALQARWEVGDQETVLTWLSANSLQEATACSWAAGLLRGEAAKQFAAEDYATTLTRLDQALRYDAVEPIDTAILRGWTRYKQRDHRAAHQSFAEAYHRAVESGDKSASVAANGLLYTAHASGDWHSLLRLADKEQGTLLAAEGERALVEQLAEGSRSMKRLEIRDGHLTPVAPGNSLLARILNPVEALPGFTWGTLRDDNLDKRSLSYVVNQGIDWGMLPGAITINTFVEYRDVQNEWRYLNNQTEGVAGLDLGRAPFHLGVEYVPTQWRNSANNESAGRGYLSWYNEWHLPHTARTSGLPISAWSGATYGRLNANFNGPASLTGYLNQGVDWFSFANGALFNTYAAYRFHLVSQESGGDDHHGPALGVELQHKPFKLGADYAWDFAPQRHTIEKRIGIYLTWYYGWDLKPQ